VSLPCPFCNASIDATARTCPYCGGVIGTLLAPGEWIAQRYEVLECMGAGPLGATYRVRDAATNVPLALKAIADELCPTAADRAALVSQLETFAGRTIAGCAMPLEVSADERVAYVTVPVIDGVSLRAALAARAAARRAFTPEEALRVLSALAAATSALHSATPHGALRPENVVVTARGVILTDCAIAMALPPERLQPRTQRFMRAAPFIASEVAAGKKITATADLFALGAIAAELLAGAPTLRALDHAGLSPEVETPLRALLDRDRARRPGALGALLDALGRTCGYQRRPADAPLPVPEVPAPGSLPPSGRATPPRARPLSPPLPAPRASGGRSEVPAGLHPRSPAPTPPSMPPPRLAVPPAAPAASLESTGRLTPPSVPLPPPRPSAPGAATTPPPAGPPGMAQIPRTGLPPAALRTAAPPLPSTAPGTPTVPPMPMSSAPTPRVPRIPTLPGGAPASKGTGPERRPVASPESVPPPRRTRDLDGIDPRLLRAARRLEWDRGDGEGEEVDSAEIELLDE
jgi:serine/threonine protein kinase